MALLKDLIVEINKRNSEKKDLPLLGVNKDKEFMPSVANVIGTDLSNYKIVKKRQFATNLMHVDRDELVPVSMLKDYDEALISPAYNVFQVKNEKIVLPEYLLLCFKRSEFDRCAWFYSGSSIRGNLDYKKFQEIDIPLPTIDKQKQIVDDYRTIQEKINIKEAINNNLNELVFAKYKLFQNSNVPMKTYKLGDVATTVLGGTPSRDIPDYWDGNISWINSGKINDFRIIDASEKITELGLKKSATVLMPKHTVVLAITGATLGQFSILLIDSCANQSVIGILENERLPYEYIYPFIRFELFELMRKQTGGAQMHINKQNVDDMLINVPEHDKLLNWAYEVRPYYSEIENNCFEIKNLKVLSELIVSKLAQQ